MGLVSLREAYRRYGLVDFDMLKDRRYAGMYLNEALRFGQEDFLSMLRLVVNASCEHAMKNLAEDTCLNREGLYRSLSPEGNPTFATLAAVVNWLGLKFTFEAI